MIWGLFPVLLLTVDVESAFRAITALQPVISICEALKCKWLLSRLDVIKILGSNFVIGLWGSYIFHNVSIFYIKAVGSLPCTPLGFLKSFICCPSLFLEKLLREISYSATPQFFAGCLVYKLSNAQHFSLISFWSVHWPGCIDHVHKR